MADRIAGAIVDLAYKAETDPKIAVEVLIGHGSCHVIMETNTHISTRQRLMLRSSVLLGMCLCISSRSLKISIWRRIKPTSFAVVIMASSPVFR
uniref:hypothetical protein n=1 Tax=Corynebacterium poyangense TaxID=2684405 RepID=UPI001CCEDCB2|nr:hypothetical protein [Corynebacterium poyangense]